MTDISTGKSQGPVAFWHEPEPQALHGVVLPAELEPTESVLRHFWRILRRQRWAVMAIVGTCVSVALLISMLTQNQYTSTVRIQVAREAAKVLDMESVEGEDKLTPNAEFYQTQYALLKSRTLAETVARSLRLSENYMFLADFDESDAESMSKLPREERFKLATAPLAESTTVVPVRGSSVIDIHVELGDAALSATIANEMAKKFIETNLSRRYEATAYARQFLQNRLNAVRARLEQSERRATEYARAQGLISIASMADGQRTEQSLPSVELGHLTSQLALARASRERAEAQFRSNTGGNAAGRSLANPAVGELRQLRGQLTAELRKLESDFGPEYPRVLALRAQVRELNQQISQEEGVVRSGVNREQYDGYREALAAEQGIQRQVDQLKRAVLNQQQRSIQFNIIQRDVDTNRSLYEALLQRFKEIGISAGIGTNNVTIVDQAVPSERPSSPNIPLNLALGLVMGILLAGGAAFILEQLAESVILPSEFQRKLGVPLLGSTPAVKGDSRNRLLSSLPGKAPNSGKEVAAQSELTEAYFSILSALQFSTVKGAPKTLLVTSTQPGEGKSTTALALARSLASVGNRVLIIDADMRNPSLHKSLGMPSGRGLSDVLTRKAGLMEVVHQLDGTQLSAVLAGLLPPNPAELLASGVLARVLETATEHFDHVILDGPPVLGLADAPLIARAAEGTLFVVESGNTRSTQARQAIERLIRVRAHIIGAVLTKLDSRSSGYGYGYGYNYEYRAA